MFLEDPLFMSIEMPGSIRYLIVTLSCLLMLSTAGAAIWYQDAQYASPTPRPLDLSQRPISSTLSLPPEVLDPSGCDARPVLLHFFNPDCPCSRFNLEHVHQLLDRYGARMRMVAILQGANAERLQNAFRETGLNVPAVTDTRGEIARTCGVYSTPQAVVLTSDGKLYYRGNYNAARYCSDPATEYARRAIDSVLAGNPSFNAPREATIAYGCQLPGAHQH